MHIFSQKALVLAIVFCAMSSVPAIIQAEARNLHTETVRVSFADLDLAKTDGLRALEMRIRGAAQQVCGEVYSKVAREIRENRECRRYALQQALRQVGLRQELAVVVHSR